DRPGSDEDGVSADVGPGRDGRVGVLQGGRARGCRPGARQARAVIRIVEVGPRDGLQSEPAAIPTDAKVAYIDALSGAGLPEIEAGAFVSPKWVPQLADSEEVFRRIRRQAGVIYSALVPNERGLER